MTTEDGDTEGEEITVRMPSGMLDRVDTLCAQRDDGTRSQIVVEAIERAAEQHG